MLPVRWVSKEEMTEKFVARFRDLTHVSTGLPDSEIDGHRKAIMNVFGFEPPTGPDAVNPVGDDAHACIAPKAGFSVGFLKAKPGNGPVLHNHNSNETFIPLGGTWRFTWETGPAKMEFVDLNVYDTISFPPGVPRCFENVVPTPGDDEGLLLAIVQDDAPLSEAMPGVMELIRQFSDGTLPTLSDGAVPLTTRQGGFGG
ncbi:cupin domain-containing protein [Burkholderia sp. BCC0419]|uniref:cupin domain-containing protein n=1 Tax=Burkholderia sp. BCC0419 TaxID=486878 RepID=UPI00158E81AC|nr:cupin domain-containing protein [Burkholderia sp. BCC0419]